MKHAWEVTRAFFLSGCCLAMGLACLVAAIKSPDPSLGYVAGAIICLGLACWFMAPEKRD